MSGMDDRLVSPFSIVWVEEADDTNMIANENMAPLFDIFSKKMSHLVVSHISPTGDINRRNGQINAWIVWVKAPSNIFGSLNANQIRAAPLAVHPNYKWRVQYLRDMTRGY